MFELSQDYRLYFTNNAGKNSCKYKVDMYQHVEAQISFANCMVSFQQMWGNDFIINVGKGINENVVEEYGIGTYNDRGDRCVQFCKEFQMPFINTFHKILVKGV